MLETRISLEQMVVELLANSELRNVEPQEPCEEAKLDKLVANRVAFQLYPRTPSAHDAVDRMLNGPFGLRACYCISPERGSSATAHVCREITDAIRESRIGLASSVSNKEIVKLTQLIEPSLCLPSAKVWFDPPTDKRAKSLEDGCVTAATWDKSRRQPQLVRTALPSLSPQQIEFSMMKGDTVPTPAFLDIKGAFVTHEGIEYVAVNKRTRSLQIHLMGWT